MTSWCPRDEIRDCGMISCLRGYVRVGVLAERLGPVNMRQTRAHLRRADAQVFACPRVYLKATRTY